MAKYEPTKWKDSLFDEEGNRVQTGTPLSATNLNKIEQGVVTVEDKVAETQATISELPKRVDYNSLTQQLADKADESSLKVEKARIDSILSLPEGSTTNDARLEDIKVSESGFVYDSPADAVRSISRDLTTYKARELGDEYIPRVLPNGVKDVMVDGGILKNTKYVVFDGSENWGGGSNVGEYTLMRLFIPDAKQGTTERYVLKQGDFLYPFGYSLDEYKHFYMRDNEIRLFVETSTIMEYTGTNSISRFKNFVRETNLEFTYELEESELLTYPTDDSLTPNTYNLVKVMNNLKEKPRTVTKFPSYYPRNTLKELISMDTLDRWTVTKDSGDTIEVVNMVNNSLWGTQAKDLINSLIPNGKKHCVKMSAHTGSSLRYTFDTPIDLTGYALAMVVFIDTESTAPLGFYDDAIDVRLYSSNVADSYRFRIQAKNCYDNNWYLFTLQPTEYNNLRNADIGDIHGIELRSGIPNGVNANVYISSILKMKNNVSRGKILLDFDDNHKAFYDEAYSYMTGKYGYRGTIHINGNKNPLTYLTVDQMLRMQDDGWVVSNHTWQHTNGLNLTYSEYEELLVKNIDWMEKQGFWYGDQIMATTNYTMNYKMYSLLKSKGFKILRAGYSNGTGSFTTLQSVTIPMGQPIPSNEVGNHFSIEKWKTHLKDVQDSKSLSVSTFHDIGVGESVTVEHFRAMIDEIKNYDIDVITYADILMGNAD